MIQYCYEKWNKNQNALRQQLEKDTFLNDCDYNYLVRLIIWYILGDEWNAEDITLIDNGGYCGTLLFLIPRNVCTPCEYDYLMTYIGYGSCSACDVLKSIQANSYHDLLTSEQVADFMKLCKELVTNMIRPYNIGWRANPVFDPVTYKDEVDEQKAQEVEKK